MFAKIHNLIHRLPSLRLKLWNNNIAEIMSSPPLPSSSYENEGKPRLPKKAKREKRRAERKEAEKKRIADKRAKKRVDSYDNDSNVLRLDDLGLTSYYKENGLRKVYPYYFKFESYAKKRWMNRRIIDIFMDEFRLSESTLIKLLAEGKIKVNDKIVKESYVVKGNDFVSNSVHRHERPVTADPIEIIEDSEEMLVVNKPSSIPVHPCGKHRFNSLTYILAKQHGYRNMRSIYRLDRMTSGLMIFSKVQGRAHEMARAIALRQTEKTYVCRVVGEFPEGKIDCDKSMTVLCHKIGLQYVNEEDGKEAFTTFERLSFNGQSSVVQCWPHTGRTHQIRVHLQYLGYPIVNDNLYNTEAWGPHKGKNGDYGKSLEQLIQDIYDFHDAWTKETNPSKETKTLNNQTETSESVIPLDKVKIVSEAETQDKTQPVSSAIENDMSEACSSNTKRLANSDNGDKHPETDQPIKRLKSDNEISESKSSPTNTTDNVISPGVESLSDCTLSDSGTQDIPGFDPTKCSYDEDCEECHKEYIDPKPSELVMYLHSWKNKGPTWNYSTDLPQWAKDDWVDHQ